MSKLINPVASLYQGCFSLTGEAHNTALVINQGEPVSGDSVHTVKFCYNISEVKKILNIEQSFSIGVGPVFGLDQKLKFLDEAHITKSGGTLVIYIKNSRGSETVTDTTFKEGRKPEDHDSAIDTFCRQHGDGYARTVTRGYEYIGLFVFSAVTDIQRRELDSSVKASGLVKGVSLGGGVNAKMEALFKNKNLSYTYHQKFIGVDDPVFVTPDFKDVESFMRSISDHLRKQTGKSPVIQAVSQGYSGVPFSPETFLKVDKNRRYFVGDVADDGLVNRLDDVILRTNAINNIPDIFRNYTGEEEFDGKEELDDRKQSLMNDRKKIIDQMKEYRDAPTKIFNKLELPSLTENNKARLVYDSRPELFGGSGGGYFDDVGDDVEAFLLRKTKLSKIEIHIGSDDFDHDIISGDPGLCVPKVSGIDATYTSRDGNGPKNIRTFNRGTRNQGYQHRTELIKLDNDEYITSIELWSGPWVNPFFGFTGGLDIIRRLIIHTNKQKNYDMGSSENIKRHQKHEVPNGWKALGFKGKCGSSIDQLGFVVAKLNAVRFEPYKARES